MDKIEKAPGFFEIDLVAYCWHPQGRARLVDPDRY
jgi:hypothetical protein